MQETELQKALLDVMRLSAKASPLAKLSSLPTLKDHPSLFLMTAINQDTGKVESVLSRTDLYEHDEKFMKLMSDITGKQFKYVELPQVVDNYMYEILDKVKNDTGYSGARNNLSEIIQGDRIRYQEAGARGGSTWKYLDSNIEFEVRYVKPMIVQEVTDANTEILATSVSEALHGIEEVKAKLLELQNEYKLTVTKKESPADDNSVEAVSAEHVSARKKASKSRKP